MVAPHAGLVAVQQIGQHRAVGDIGGVATIAWISLVRLSTPKCAFAELPLIALFRLMGTRALSAFLVEDGAVMIVASKIVPVTTFSRFAATCRCT